MDAKVEWTGQIMLIECPSPTEARVSTRRATLEYASVYVLVYYVSRERNCQAAFVRE